MCTEEGREEVGKRGQARTHWHYLLVVRKGFEHVTLALSFHPVYSRARHHTLHFIETLMGGNTRETSQDTTTETQKGCDGDSKVAAGSECGHRPKTRKTSEEESTSLRDCVMERRKSSQRTHADFWVTNLGN